MFMMNHGRGNAMLARDLILNAKYFIKSKCEKKPERRIQHW